MSNHSDFLDFDQAVEFLKTTPSTLYKWLQAGKIPGHKLGRQWRFLREELELHISGRSPKIQTQKELLNLANLLELRAIKPKSPKEEPLNLQPQDLTEKLIWDAYDHGSRIVHITPNRGQYEIKYRTAKGLEKLTSLQEDFFHQLDESLRTASQPIRGENSRRLHLQRSFQTADSNTQQVQIQIRYQRTETVIGPRLTLRLWEPQNDILPLEKIVNDDASTLMTFRNWLQAPKGLILITGADGSGKTTTMHSFLHDVRKEDLVVFTLENPAEMIIDDVNQVEMTAHTKDELNRAVEQIMQSDPDIVSFGLSSYKGLEDTLFPLAQRLASTGHLVLMLMDAPSCAKARDEFQRHIPLPIDEILVGISAQKLEQGNDGRFRCHYEIEDHFKKSAAN